MIDSSAILRAVLYIPGDHEIGDDDDDDGDDDKRESMNKMKEIFLHFLLMMKISESEKIFVTVYFIATTEKYCDVLELRYKSYLLFLITPNLKKKSFWIIKSHDS